MVLVMLVVVAAGFYIRLPRWRLKLPAMLAALAIALTAIGLTPALKQRMSLLGEIKDTKFETFDRLLSGRLTIWETASHMLRARPLNGVGAGAFDEAYDNYSTRPDDRFRGSVKRRSTTPTRRISRSVPKAEFRACRPCSRHCLCVKWYRGAPAARRDQAWPYALGLFVYFFPINTQPPLITATAVPR